MKEEWKNGANHPPPLFTLNLYLFLTVITSNEGLGGWVGRNVLQRVKSRNFGMPIILLSKRSFKSKMKESN